MINPIMSLSIYSTTVSNKISPSYYFSTKILHGSLVKIWVWF
jgi:hypothetical protein